MRYAVVSSLALVAALTAGCGSSPSADPAPVGAAGTNTDAGSGPPAALPKFCELLTADQVTGAVGAPVTLATGPFDACEFKQEDVRAVSGSLGVVEVGTDAGGFETYRSGSVSTLHNGTAHTVTDVGDDAFVATGTFGGGTNLQAAAGALVADGRVYTVNLAQADGMSEAQLVTISSKLLHLLVDAG